MCSMRWSAAAFLCAWALGAMTATADEPKGKKPSVVMEKKLEYSEGLLKALVTGDFDLADRNVKLMKTFTRLEEMYRGKRPEYGEQLRKFQDANAALSKAVDNKNLNEASAAYGRMVQSCIRCHQVIRDGDR